MVLLKGHDERGFVFYTNAGSRKGGEIAANPRRAAVSWKTLRRQVRVEGAVSPVTAAETAAYFATRSRESQLGAWASDQSNPLPRRATLDERYAEIVRRFEGQDVPCPPNWGGFRVAPERFEFWRDGAHRLHERRTFARVRGGWTTGCSTRDAVAPVTQLFHEGHAHAHDHDAHGHGPRAISTRTSRLADDARRAGQRRHGLVPARAQGLRVVDHRLGRHAGVARRHRARPHRSLVCSTASASPPCPPITTTASGTARPRRLPPCSRWR
jgi:pyridoxamine 5'-phosphate oxidase